MMKTIKLPKISRSRFTFETYGVKKGVVTPCCYDPVTDTFEPLEDWIVVGYCKDPEILSCTGGRRPFAIMYECQKDIPSDYFPLKAGNKVWYHCRKLPKFTSLVGE